MNIKMLLLITLSLTSSHVLANELEEVQAQQGELRREIDSLHQETANEQARLEELKRLIQEQHEKNELLDKQLEAERLRQQPERE
jgi:peptidoglycan hydrolase CwlO-like protein